MIPTDTWTYQDVVEHLLDVFDSERAGRPLRLARRAASQTLRDLALSHRWKCYEASRFLRTEVPYSTGTIAYDHTGGTSERLVTLTAGTFPATAAYQSISIAGYSYRVDQRIDNVNVTLYENDNPGSDVVAGTTYELFRPSYPLPIGFIEMGEMWDVVSQLPVAINTPDDAHRAAVCYPEPDNTWEVSIQSDPDYVNRLVLYFGTPPSEERVYSYSYHRSPRQLFTEKYSTGTVTVGAGSTTCSIVTGAFVPAHVGCIIRFGTAANEPDGFFGGLTDTENIYAEQRTIISVAAGGASCVLDSVLENAVTGVKFTVSDPLDLDNTVMLTAFQRMAEEAYSLLTKRDQKERLDRKREAMQALLEAKEKDSRSLYASSQYDSPMYDVTVTDLDDV